MLLACSRAEMGSCIFIYRPLAREIVNQIYCYMARQDCRTGVEYPTAFPGCRNWPIRTLLWYVIPFDFAKLWVTGRYRTGGFVSEEEVVLPLYPRDLCYGLLKVRSSSVMVDLSSCGLTLNFSQVKIKYEFSKPFPCDCWYVQQNMIIHDILTRPFSEKYKIWRKVNDKDFSCWRQCISKMESIMWRSRLCPIQP